GAVFDPDVNDPNPVNVTVSGAAPGATDSDKVDIYCVYNLGPTVSDIASGGVQDVTITGAAFSAQLNLQLTSFYSCKLIAVPDGAGPRSTIANNDGPVIHASGFRLEHVSGGPNDGDLFDYQQDSAALEGYWE